MQRWRSRDEVDCQVTRNVAPSPGMDADLKSRNVDVVGLSEAQDGRRLRAKPLPARWCWAHRRHGFELRRLSFEVGPGPAPPLRRVARSVGAPRIVNCIDAALAAGSSPSPRTTPGIGGAPRALGRCISPARARTSSRSEFPRLGTLTTSTR